VVQKAHKVCLTLTHCARNVDAALQSRMEFGWKTRSRSSCGSRKTPRSHSQPPADIPDAEEVT